MSEKHSDLAGGECGRVQVPWLEVDDIDEMADRYGDHDKTNDCYSFNREGKNSVRALVAEVMRRAPRQIASTAGKYDDVLHPFFLLMEKELHANTGKGDRPGWLKMDANTALLEVYWHATKLSAAVKNNDGPAIMEHSADVANMAMMVLDVCVGIQPPANTAGAQAADTNRLDHLQIMADNGCVSMCFEMDGGFHVTLEGVSEEPEAARNVDSIRDGIDWHIAKATGATK